MKTKKQLIHKIAQLESINDQLAAELAYVDHLMRVVGFSNGLETVKETAHEIINESEELYVPPDDYEELL